MEGFDSLTTIRNSWTIDDVMDAHDLLNYREDEQARAYRAAQPTKGGK